MDNLILFINYIDWLFAAVIIIGGRYWGGKYFKVTNNAAWNFLFFASFFGSIWIFIQYLNGGVTKDELNSIFITYLFATSFYELLGKGMFELIEHWIGRKKDEPKQ